MTEDAAMHELKKNIKAYNAIREELERKHRGRTALLHDGQLISIYNDRWDARDIGCERFGEGRFSIKTIGTPPASLGAATMYAIPVPIE